MARCPVSYCLIETGTRGIYETHYVSQVIGIELGDRFATETWQPKIQVCAVEDPITTLRTLPVRPFSGTEERPETYALQAAKKGIDAGKPDVLSDEWFESIALQNYLRL